MNYIKGKHSVREALSSGNPDRIVVDFNVERSPDIQDLLIMARQRGVRVQNMQSKAFREAYGDTAQGIVAVTTQLEFHELSLILDRKEEYPLVLITDHLEDPYNFGAILRSAEQFGAKAVVFPKDRQVPINAGVIKASSGAVQYLDLIRVNNLADAIEKLKKAGYWVYGADSGQGEYLDEITPTFPAVIVVGNEHKGLSNLIQKKLDFKIKIPMCGHLDSLNVSVATGIMLYSFSRPLQNRLRQR